MSVPPSVRPYSQRQNVVQNTVSSNTRKHSVEHGICPIAAQAVTLCLPSYCLSNAMHSIGQNIRSLWNVRCPSGRPALYKIVTSFMDRCSPNLEHGFPVPCRRKFFWSSSTGSSIRACATINRPPLTRPCFRIYLRLYISKTVQDRGSMFMEHL